MILFDYVYIKYHIQITSKEFYNNAFLSLLPGDSNIDETSYDQVKKVQEQKVTLDYQVTHTFKKINLKSLETKDKS